MRKLTRGEFEGRSTDRTVARQLGFERAETVIVKNVVQKTDQKTDAISDVKSASKVTPKVLQK